MLYRSLAKECPWAEHLTSLPRKGVGALSSVSTFNHEGVPMSCLQQLKALEANNSTNNNIQRNHQQLQNRNALVAAAETTNKLSLLIKTALMKKKVICYQL